MTTRVRVDKQYGGPRIVWEVLVATRGEKKTNPRGQHVESWSLVMTALVCVNGRAGKKTGDKNPGGEK